MLVTGRVVYVSTSLLDQLPGRPARFAFLSCDVRNGKACLKTELRTCGQDLRIKSFEYTVSSAGSEVLDVLHVEHVHDGRTRSRRIGSQL